MFKALSNKIKIKKNPKEKETSAATTTLSSIINLKNAVYEFGF
jgi:hypothetical protein